MQIAARSTILLTLLYLLGLVGAATWLDRDFRETSRDVMTDTAELIANQLRAALYEPIIDRVLERDADAVQQLRDTISEAIDRSDTILKLAAVGADGDLLTLDEDEKNLSYPTAEALFGNQPVTQVASEFRSRFQIGRHIALVPLTRVGELVAYLRIEISNRHINGVYERLVSRFANFALVGVASILILGGLLHLELSRIGRDVIGLMKSNGPTTVRKQRFGVDEFESLRVEASQLGADNMRSRGALDALSEAMKVGVMLFDEDGNERFISDNARELVGGDENQQLKDTLGASWKKLSAELKKLEQSDKKSTALKINIEHGGLLRKLEFEIYRIGGTHGPTLALIRNQEQVAALETSLRAATRMHTLSSIYMGAAHDLRAPISAMVMNLELLEDSIQENTGAIPTDEIEDQQRYVSILKEELNRLQRFLTSFLDNSTMSRYTGRHAVELSAVIEELFGLFRVRARLADVNLETRFPGHGVWIVGSGDQLRQMLMNIIVNALEVMPEGGTLTAEIRREDGLAVLTLQDTGPGIPSTVLEHIFELHFTTKDTGTGIGLHVARTIALQHGGELVVDSILGRGTAFNLTLPAIEEPAEERVEEPANKPAEKP